MFTGPRRWCWLLDVSLDNMVLTVYHQGIVSEGVPAMPRGGANNVKTHVCNDGQVREVRAVYFRDIDPQTGKRLFKRETWFCGHCGYGLLVKERVER